MDQRLRALICLSFIGAAPVLGGVDVNNYSFLTVDEGAWALGTSAGYVLAAGTDAIMVNPAGLARTDYPRVSLDGGTFAGRSSTNLCFAGWGAGANFRYFKIQDGLEGGYGPITAFGEEGLLISGGYGRAITPSLNLGAALSIMTFLYGKHDGGAPGLDAGAVYRFTPELTAGLGVKHLGGEIEWKAESEIELHGHPAPRKVPSFAVAGLAYETWGGKLSLAGDLYAPLHLNEIDGRRGDAIYGRAGVEYWPWRWMVLRGGYRSGLDELGMYVTFGVGFRFGDFDVATALAPPGSTGDYVTHGGEYKEIPGGAFALGAAYSFGRSRAEGVAETEERLSEEFEKQKKVMVGQLLGQAEKFYARERYEDALETLNIIMVWEPENERAAELLPLAQKQYERAAAVAHVGRAREYLEAGSVADALVEAKKALELDAGNEDAAAIRAEAEMTLARESGAAETGVTELLAAGQREYEKGNYTAAISKWSTVLGRDPGNRVAATSIGAAQVRMAAEESESLTSARAAEEAGRVFEARRYYEAALRANPASADAGAALERLDAEASARADALAKKAASALDAGEYGRAEALANDALAYQPDNGRARSVLAAVSSSREKKPGAEAARRDYRAVYMKGIEAYTDHNYAAAIAYWEQIPAESDLYAKAARNIERAKTVLKKLEE
jgi:Tfp pilus assembly protein PilF